MRKIILLLYFSLFVAARADQLSQDEIDRRKTKEQTTIIHFDVARNGREAAVTMQNAGESEFTWRMAELTCVNGMGDLGEVVDVQEVNSAHVVALLAIPAHEKRMYRVRFTCPATKPAAFIWQR